MTRIYRSRHRDSGLPDDARRLPRPRRRSGTGRAQEGLTKSRDQYKCTRIPFVYYNIYDISLRPDVACLLGDLDERPEPVGEHVDGDLEEEDEGEGRIAALEGALQRRAVGRLQLRLGDVEHKVGEDERREAPLHQARGVAAAHRALRPFDAGPVVDALDPGPLDGAQRLDLLDHLQALVLVGDTHGVGYAGIVSLFVGKDAELEASLVAEHYVKSRRANTTAY